MKGGLHEAMEHLSLKSRAIAFAICAGALVFILALIAGTGANDGAVHVARSLVVAIICGVMTWGSAERAVAGVAAAVDAVTARVRDATEGDLVSPLPADVLQNLPDLARSLDGLFVQTRSNLESVHALAMYDPVTSLPNRTHFRREAERMLGEMPLRAPAAMLFVDLDRFKQVNDSLGHAHGDQLLVMVANRLRIVTSSDNANRLAGEAEVLVARLAGDEFTLLLPTPRSSEDPMRVARRILYALSEPFELAGQTIEIGASIGVALRPAHGIDLTQLMKAADIAMYHAKAMGRGQVQLYTDALASQFEDRLTLERELRRALENDEFELAFQPQIDARSGTAVSAEALIRWRHPSEGLRLPGSFIAVAEDSGLIVEIGDWVIDAVARTLVHWESLGITQRLALNVSPRQLDRPDFFPRLSDALASHGANPRLLELEITESIAMDCSEAVIEGIAALRRRGVSIAIDDFGTGYSNLARLKDMPLDRVKLDRSLVADIVGSQEARTLCHAVINLVHGLGYTAVAEGIEHIAQFDVLRVIGCDAFQGYAIATPMEEAAFCAWVRSDKAESFRPRELVSR